MNADIERLNADTAHKKVLLAKEYVKIISRLVSYLNGVTNISKLPKEKVADLTARIKKYQPLVEELREDKELTEAAKLYDELVILHREKLGY